MKAVVYKEEYSRRGRGSGPKAGGAGRCHHTNHHRGNLRQRSAHVQRAQQRRARHVFGRENQGLVEEVGKGVVSIQRGDRVVLPYNIGCGFCFNCSRGFTNACLTANPKGPTAEFRYDGMGPYRGGQAEFLRVPFADFNCLKLPGKPGDEFETISYSWPTSFPPAGTPPNWRTSKAAIRSQ
jgi:threonine dehydrogenase-like Zn-dependent dehydrogenase